MARSLGLSAYRAFTGRGGVPPFTPVAKRPTGELVWCHAPEPGSLFAIQDLAIRLCRSRPGLSVLITVPQALVPVDLPPCSEADVLIDTLPEDHPTLAKNFIDYWQPDACVWAWGRLHPNMIAEMTTQACPMFLIDADSDGFDGRRDRWLRDLTRDLLMHFSAIMTRSEAGMQRLVRLGLARKDIELTPALQAGGRVLPCMDSDLADLSAAVVGRPIWFANQVLEGELNTVLTAHRQGLRLSHRLLLILAPADPKQADVFAQRMEDQNFRVLRWGDAGYPDASTQVMIADDPAVLYGPKVRRYLPLYTRLAAEGAARIVNDATALGTAVNRLIAPDQAATMAQAGWDVISRGAAVTDKVIDLVQETLDQREATS